MATFDYNIMNSYELSGGVFTSFGAVPTTGTIDDGDGAGAGSFEAGEVVTGGGSFGSDVETFQGTVVINGETFVLLFSSGDGGLYNLYATVDNPGTFVFPSTITAENFVISNTDPSDPFITCFAAGTLIATPDGERAVETLEIGDLVTTSDGRAVSVRWLGRQTRQKLFTLPERLRPVRIAAGALGNGLPHTDLVVTADHGIVIEGYVVNASALVGAPDIAYVPLEEIGNTVVFYHIETEGHRIVLANGAPAETYVDYVARRAFDNYAEFVTLYGDDDTIEEMDLPRVSSLRQMPAALRERFGLTETAITFSTAA